MIAISILLILLTASLVSINLLFIQREIRGGSDDFPDEPEYFPFSILIPAKNEKSTVGILLRSLKKLDYPVDKFEIIIIDDNSTDGTAEEVGGYAHQFENLRLIRAGVKELSRKRGALQIGLMNSKFPTIITTDADCEVQSKWLECISGKISQNCEMIIGLTAYQQSGGFLNSLCCFENLRSRILIASMAKIGLPYSAAGGNFTFKRSFVERIGGFAALPDTIGGEDDLLLQEGVKSKLNIRVMDEPGSIVFTRAPGSFKEYVKQKARHTQTSFHYNLFHRIILASWHSVNIVILLSPLLCFIDYLFLLPLTLKLLFDSLLVKIFEKKLKYRFGPFQIITLQLIYEIMIVINIFNARFSDHRWK